MHELFELDRRAQKEMEGVGNDLRKVSLALPSLESTPRLPSLSAQVHR